MNPADQVCSLWGGPNPGRPVAAHELPNELPVPYWMDRHRPKMFIEQPRAINYGPLASEMIADALLVEARIRGRVKRIERMKGQAEGLIIGLALAGFFGLLLKWSF